MTSNFSFENSFVDALVGFLKRLATSLPSDIVDKLNELATNETSPLAKEIYNAYLLNLDVAKNTNRPICQDTGAVQFFIKVGTKFPLKNIENLIVKALKIATNEIPLRPNSYEIFKANSGNDSKIENHPYIEYSAVWDTDTLEIDVYMSGGGSNLPARAEVFLPSEGLNGAINLATDIVLNKGLNACPPLVIGIGLSGCLASSAKLSKKALLRRLDEKNKNNEACAFEKNLEDKLNKIGIGPQGLVGNSSVLAVNVEHGYKHPSAMAVAISTGCYVMRRGTILFDASLNHIVKH